MAQLISSYNVAHQLQNYVCEALSASEWLQRLSVQFFPENAKDIDFQIKNALARQGLACIVMTPNLQYQGHNGTDIAWDARDLTLQIAEFTPVNRASNKLSVVTGLDLAVFAQNYLGGPQCAEEFGKFCPKAIQQSEEGGLLITKATFDTTVLGSIPGPYEWDGHHVITVPWAFLSDLQDLSSYVHNMPDAGELSAQVAVISGDLGRLSTYVKERCLPISGGWMWDGDSFIGMTDDSQSAEAEFNARGISLKNVTRLRQLSASSQGVNLSAHSDQGGDPASLLSSITFTINGRTKSLADVLGEYASGCLKLSGGVLDDGASIRLTDLAWAVESEINGHYIRIEDTASRDRFSASPGGVNFYAESEEEADPAGLLSAITFTLNNETRTLADILSGYVSRQYVDDMIGDLEHLLETT